MGISNYWEVPLFHTEFSPKLPIRAERFRMFGCERSEPPPQFITMALQLPAVQRTASVHTHQVQWCSFRAWKATSTIMAQSGSPCLQGTPEATRFSPQFAPIWTVLPPATQII